MAKLEQKADDADSSDSRKDKAEIPEAGSTPASGRESIYVFALCIFVFLVFSPVLGNGFLLYDDYTYVTGNIHVLRGLTWENTQWAFETWRAANWHPLTWLSHMLDVQLFGLRPWGHHLTSLLLHAANTGLVFLVVRRMTGAVWRSLFAAALFGVHPLHVESVAWVAERKDVLSTTFWMLSLWAYARFAGPPAAPGAKNKIFYALSLAFLALGLMSKPMLVTAPFLMLLLDYWPLRRWERNSVMKLLLEKAPFFLLAAASAVVTFLAQRAGNAISSATELPFSGRVASALVAYAAYLGKIFCPVRLAVPYPLPNHLPPAEVLLAGLMVFGLSVIAFRQRHVRPFLFTGWAWFLGALVPVIGLVQVGAQSMADRYTYVPAIGIFIAATWWVFELTNHLRHQAAWLAGAALIILALCAGISIRQVGYWENNGTLFRHTLAVTRDNRIARSALADYELNLGHVERAIELYREAVKLKPADALAHGHLGTALCQAGQMDEGIKELELAIQTDPGLAEAHANLGLALLQEGRANDALSEMATAVNLRPDSIALRNYFGLALERNGRLDEAIAQFGKVIQLFPNDVDAHVNLGLALEENGRLDEAVREFREALRIKPDNAAAQGDLSRALIMKGASDRQDIQMKPGG